MSWNSCRPEHITWHGLKGYQCLNCGATGPHSWSIRHKQSEEVVTNERERGQSFRQESSQGRDER